MAKTRVLSSSEQRERNSAASLSQALHGSSQLARPTKPPWLAPLSTASSSSRPLKYHFRPSAAYILERYSSERALSNSRAAARREANARP